MSATHKTVNYLSLAFIALSALSFLYVSLLAFFNPQAVMDLVSVSLPNPDAFSSIRGIYGGVGLAIVIHLIFLARTEKRKALVFLMLIWGLYAFSRLLTQWVEGALGDFGKQWLLIEIVFFVIAAVLLALQQAKK
ncbi:DUF4345 domain-containing protein [Hugenholtzia roseola]|uniref:DUF4345 domain-containing protein n=1 Tax=Hugenholtzia roseola TaxID=1002 RepID=UPI0003F582E5|nr:DUF4345 domain-containing protein [Hugenholtzia roseola]